MLFLLWNTTENIISKKSFFAFEVSNLLREVWIACRFQLISYYVLKSQKNFFLQRPNFLYDNFLKDSKSAEEPTKSASVILKLVSTNLPASRAHSHRAFRSQSLSAPSARDSIVALRSFWTSRFALGLVLFAYI